MDHAHHQFHEDEHAQVLPHPGRPLRQYQAGLAFALKSGFPRGRMRPRSSAARSRTGSPANTQHHRGCAGHQGEVKVILINHGRKAFAPPRSAAAYILTGDRTRMNCKAWL